jgi:hypothetical protein
MHTMLSTAREPCCSPQYEAAKHPPHTCSCWGDTGWQQCEQQGSGMPTGEGGERASRREERCRRMLWGRHAQHKRERTQLYIMPE